MSGGHLFVISGASGVGKSTILKQVMAMRPQLQFSVSATSRAPREGETDGVQYFFVSEDAFREMIDQGAFVEYDYHMGNFYGTLKSEIIKKTKQSGMILDVEPVGAFNVRAKRPDAVLIFVAPPSRQILEQRLRGRGDTGEEQIVMRLARADWEMEQSKRYDYVVINDQVEACADRILHIIAQEADR